MKKLKWLIDLFLNGADMVIDEEDRSDCESDVVVRRIVCNNSSKGVLTYHPWP